MEVGNTDEKIPLPAGSEWSDTWGECASWVAPSKVVFEIKSIRQHIMKRIFTLLFITIGLSCNSQDRVTFKVRYKPETTYNQVTNQTSETTVKYSGTQKVLQTLKDQGVDNPTIARASFMARTIYKTEKLVDNKFFPLSVQFIETSGIAGKPPIPNGTKIYGTGSVDGMPTLDSVSGNLSVEMKMILLQTMQKFFSQIEFPDERVRIGETFSTQTPLIFPIAGTSLEISITTIYKLVNVKANLAMIDLTQEYALKSIDTGYDIKVTGTGKGNLIYEIPNQFNRRYQVDTDMRIIMKLDQFDVDINTKSGYLQEIEIVKD